METSEQKAQQNADNIVSLRDHIEQRLKDMDKATNLAYTNLEKRLDAMNEFRQSLKDQNSTFLTQGEYHVWKKSVDEDIRVLRESKSEIAGKADQKQVNNTSTWAYIGLIFSIINLIIMAVRLF